MDNTKSQQPVESERDKNLLLLSVWDYLHSVSRRNFDPMVVYALVNHKQNRLEGRRGDLIIKKCLLITEYHRHLIFLMKECHIIPHDPEIINEIIKLFPDDVINIYISKYPIILHMFSCSTKFQELRFSNFNIFRMIRHHLNMIPLSLNHIRKLQTYQTLNTNEIDEVMNFIISDKFPDDLFTELILRCICFA